MVHRRKTRLTREGWYYLFVTIFILGGAVLRDVNLLVVLAGMMIGPVLFNWRLATTSLRGITIRRHIPRRVSADEPISVELTISNQRRYLRAKSLMITDRVRPEGTVSRNVESIAKALIASVDDGEVVNSSYRIRLPHRGRYVFGPLQYHSGAPLGLVRATHVLKGTMSVVAYPKLGRLSRHWLKVVQGQNVGSQLTQRRGHTEGDYYGLRDWRNGDSRRWIHWRTSAKRGTLSVLQFEQPRNRDLALVLDLWRPPVPTEKDLIAVEFAVSFAASAIVDFCRRGGLLAFVALGESEQRWTAPATFRLSQEILDHLAEVSAGTEVNSAQVIQQLQQRHGGDQKTIVISTRPTQWMTNAAPDERVLWLDVSDESTSHYFEL